MSHFRLNHGLTNSLPGTRPPFTLLLLPLLRSSQHSNDDNHESPRRRADTMAHAVVHFLDWDLWIFSAGEFHCILFGGHVVVN